jgi:hypothetical protein
MNSTVTLRRTLTAASALTAVLFFSQATMAFAQSTASDARWRPWIGCWTPAQNAMQPMGAPSAPAKQVCVLPAGGSAVDIVNVANGKIVDRTHVDANGAQQALAHDGCNGWQSAQWSADERRVYMRSEYSCGGTGKHVADGMIAMLQTGEWLDVQGIGPADNQLVRTVRYRELSDVAGMPAEVKGALQALPSNSNARWAAEAPVAFSDVIEASKSVDAPVVAAWIAERGQQFPVDAKQLVKLADAGVPAPIIDVLVAVSYPKVFAISQYSHTGDFRGPETATALQDNPQHTIYAGNMYYDPFGYSGYGYGGYGSNAYGYSPYSNYGYNGYGYSPYSPYSYGYGPPIIIVPATPGGTGATTTHGRAVKGHGYSDGSSSSGSSSASSSNKSSGSSASSGSSGSSSSGSSSSSSGRTAKARN